MTFRTPDEAVELANNTRYGLAASVWTENINLALDVAPKIRAGTVWVNCTNVFDAASGFGGYRESGFGREGGMEGLWEYVQGAAGQRGRGAGVAEVAEAADATVGRTADRQPLTGPPIDRTAKLYIGGKQVRPDGGYSLPVTAPDGTRLGWVARGNRKDIRNAVEAAHQAAGWGRATAHLRAQVLYYVAENLAARAEEFAARISRASGAGETDSADEVGLAVRRLFTCAAWADKFDGRVHHTPFRNVTLAMPEPVGVMGIVCPDAPGLLGLVSLVAPALAMGNTVVVIPSQTLPLAATDFYQVLDTSDVPPGVVNLVTGVRDELAEVLAGHDDVEAMWYVGPAEGRTMVERLSAGNMKRTWVSGTLDGWDAEELLRQATQVKNIWIPYGE
jgi:aldehyde dehydrogenase (NAD+)